MSDLSFMLVKNIEMRAKYNMELLDELVDIVDCMYISNLCYQTIISMEQQKRIETINADDYSLKEWQDALEYILKTRVDIISVDEGKKVLLNYFRSK